MKPLSAVDRRLVEEAALAALEYGRHAADSKPLEEAAERFRFLLERPAPNNTARAQLATRLGEALWRLGERQADPQTLEDAVNSLSGAVGSLARENAPLEWAATQSNLGIALASLGERETGTARLEKAVTAYRAALQAYTRERVPLDWATTQNSLGDALRMLGEREGGTARLEEALEAFRAALEELTRVRVPLDWAMTQNSLGNALAALGERENGTARLEQAVEAYRAALRERTRERRAAGLGGDAEQPRHAPLADARRARERHGAA